MCVCVCVCVCGVPVWCYMHVHVIGIRISLSVGKRITIDIIRKGLETEVFNTNQQVPSMQEK